MFFIPVSYKPELLGIVLLGIKTNQFNCHIGKYILGESAFPFDRFVLQVFLCPDNEECVNLMNLIQHLKIVISPVKDVVRTRFIRDFFHCL